MIPTKQKRETHPVAKQHRDILLDFTKDVPQSHGQPYLESVETYYEDLMDEGPRKLELLFGNTFEIGSTVRAIAFLYELSDRGLVSSDFKIDITVHAREVSYGDYLQSAEWKAKANAAKERAGRRCQVCNASGLLDTHHRTYDRIGNEQNDDLIVLCRGCHTLFHENGKLAR